MVPNQYETRRKTVVYQSSFMMGFFKAPKMLAPFLKCARNLWSPYCKHQIFPPPQSQWNRERADGKEDEMRKYLVLEYSGRAKLDICLASGSVAGVRTQPWLLSPSAGGRRKQPPSRSDGGCGDCPSAPPRSSSGYECLCRSRHCFQNEIWTVLIYHV